MAGYTPEALGKVIRDLRKERSFTQAQLGERAGYGRGAGVSVSRIENGLMEPSDERLKELARELDISQDELVARAIARDSAARNASNGGVGRTKDRIARIKEAIVTRQQLVRDIEAFNSASRRGEEDFLLRFQEIAKHLEDAPQPDPKNFTVDQPMPGSDATSEASAQLRFTQFGVEQALSDVSGGALDTPSTGEVASEVFMRLAATGVFSLGSALPAITAASVLKPLQRASGMRPGTGLAGEIIGIVLATAVAAWVQTTTARTRKQQQAITEAEEAIDKTQPGVEALAELVPRATRILDYIAVYASHALERWAARISTEPHSWTSLTPREQDQYFEFAEIAAAQLAVATMKIDDLLTPRTDTWERDRLLTDAILTDALRVVTTHV